ncbi:hypothetical protein LTR66_014127 [Elasticomyces elasticus]|nr:hypothetical protein LTR66_014127 [Elasticomyces elasticus]
MQPADTILLAGSPPLAIPPLPAPEPLQAGENERQTQRRTATEGTVVPVQRSSSKCRQLSAKMKAPVISEAEYDALPQSIHEQHDVCGIPSVLGTTSSSHAQKAVKLPLLTAPRHALADLLHFHSLVMCLPNLSQVPAFGTLHVETQRLTVSCWQEEVLLLRGEASDRRTISSVLHHADIYL